jgi:hypothetical protein
MYGNNRLNLQEIAGCAFSDSISEIRVSRPAFQGNSVDFAGEDVIDRNPFGLDGRDPGYWFH